MSSQTSLELRLADQDESVRAFAAEDAGFDNNVEAIEPLVARLRVETSRFVRDAIFTALARMTHATVVDHAVQLLESDDAFLRNEAVTLLRTRGQDAIERLIETFRQTDADVRKFLLDAVSGMPGQHPEGLLLLGLEDPDINVRIAAIEHLGTRVRPELKEQFETVLLREDDPMLLSTVLTALEEVGDAETWSIVEQRYPNPSEYLPFLAPQILRLMAKWGSYDCLGKLFAVNVKIRASRMGDWLDSLETLHDRFRFRTLSAEQFGTIWAEYEGSSNTLSQYRLLRWFGRLEDQPDILNILTSQLLHENSTVRKGAVLGIAKLGTAAARGTLLSHLPIESDPEVRAILTDNLAEESGAQLA